MVLLTINEFLESRTNHRSSASPGRFLSAWQCVRKSHRNLFSGNRFQAPLEFLPSFPAHHQLVFVLVSFLDVGTNLYPRILKSTGLRIPLFSPLVVDGQLQTVLQKQVNAVANLTGRSMALAINAEINGVADVAKSPFLQLRAQLEEQNIG